MQPWIAERIERERDEQREGQRVPLYIEPPAPSRPDEDCRHEHQDERRGWCVIDDTLDDCLDDTLVG